MSPGELTLAASRQLEAMGKTPARLETSQEHSIDELESRVDLIALDSPFVSNSPEPSVVDDFDFGALWDSIEDADVRGWYHATIDSAVRRLQGLRYNRLQVGSADLPPFIGDLKVTVSSAHDTRPLAALRLRESEEHSCLWRLRSRDVTLRAQIRQLLTEID
ncbi:hypothetical protein LshimejAT787_0403400 [Lyophyllum shimeji]|uniref:Uncharacterized protein n=1 Tax=Lyophyllum shimeji TaxID=47721 RepID=A0A9P3PKV1_LYOSH|nr:hypothetical protein LshimejAT787_0403400 [Lyophyllum shimeji]